MADTSSRGFSLLEALIAALLVAGAIAGLARLVALAASQTTSVRRHTLALTLAQGKLEELRSADWTYAPDGSAVSSPLLAPSPPGALLADYDGYADAAQGFRRRWAITAFDAGDADTLVVHVCVLAPERQRAGAPPVFDACVSGVRLRGQ